MKLVSRLVAESTENVVLQVPRALVASALAAAIDTGGLLLLVWAGWNPQAAAVVSYLLGGVVQYVLCSLWVFPAAPQSVSVGFAAFTFLSLVGLAITWATIAVLHEWAGINLLFTKGVALGLAFSWNFLSRKYWLFRTGLRQEVVS